MFSQQQLPFEDKLQRSAADVVSLLSYTVATSLVGFQFRSFLHLSSFHAVESSSSFWPLLTHSGRQKKPSIYQRSPSKCPRPQFNLLKGQIEIFFEL